MAVCLLFWWRLRLPSLFLPLLLQLLPLTVDSFLIEQPSFSLSAARSTFGDKSSINTSITCLNTASSSSSSSWESHVSTHPDAFNAFNKLYNKEVMGDKGRFDLCLLFVGQAHAADFETLVQHAYRQISSAPHGIQFVALLGGGCIGEGIELDKPHRPSMSLLIGTLPEGAEVKVVQYSNDNNDSDNDDNLLSNAASMLGQLEDRFTSCLVFADPWAPVERLLSSSGSRQRILAGGITCPFLADQSTLAVNGRCLPQGSVIGIGFAGTLGLQTMVAQGCRPIAGALYRITACDGNVITKLDGKPAMQVLQNVANQAPPEEQEQISSGLLCGIIASSSESSSTDSSSADCDFLSRQIIGFAPSVQGIAIGTTQIHVGDLFCFQVRDGTTAQQDLKLMVQRAKTERLFDTDDLRQRPVAAIQISCVARGRGMFGGIPNVDLSNVQELLVVDTTSTKKNNREESRATPVVAGFFANGEIGPVGLAGFSTTKVSDGQAYLHSFTTVAATLCEYTPLASSSSGGQLAGERDEDSSLDAWG